MRAAVPVTEVAAQPCTGSRVVASSSSGIRSGLPCISFPFLPAFNPYFILLNVLQPLSPGRGEHHGTQFHV